MTDRPASGGREAGERQKPPLMPTPPGKKPCRWWWQTFFCHPPVQILGLLHERCAWCGRQCKWQIEDDDHA